MNSAAVNDSVVEKVEALLGKDVVLVPQRSGSKIPVVKGWPQFTRKKMEDPLYIKLLNSGCNVAVLVGTSSGGVCSIDLDSDDDAEEFLELNPSLRYALRTVGRRGCNLWVKIEGEFPRGHQIKDEHGNHWGEWRADGCLTTIHGVHESGCEYQVVSGSEPVGTSFASIQWPEHLNLPWKIEVDEALARIEERFGPRAFFRVDDKGKRTLKDINQAFWAGLYADENIALYEPNEDEFYLYKEDTGLYVPESADSIKQVISSRILGASRSSDDLYRLVEFRRNRDLNAIVSQLKGVIEKRNAFAKTRRTIHLSNCMLVFENGELGDSVFSPDFFSRNQSPIAFAPEAQCPRFLNEMLIPAVHPEDVKLIQKYVGQCLLGTNLIQRILILDGQPKRGKTQLANLIQNLIGMTNVTQLRTQHLHERFEIFKFLRKTLLVGVDVDADFLASKGATALKGLVGGDWFDAEKKGGTGSFQIQGCFNVIMTSNCRLRVRLQGDVGAWRRRLLLVRYEAPPIKKEIKNISDVLLREEGPGILNWGIAGLQALLTDIAETGDIRLTPRQEGIVDSLLAESDSLRTFLAANVEKSPGSDLAAQEIVQAYADFCPEMGWDPLPDTIIGRQMPDLMLELFQAVKAHDIKRDGRSLRGFRNVVLKSKSD